MSKGKYDGKKVNVSRVSGETGHFDRLEQPKAGGEVTVICDFEPTRGEIIVTLEEAQVAEKVTFFGGEIVDVVNA